MCCFSHKRWETLVAVVTAVTDHSAKGLVLCQMVAAGAPLGAIKGAMESDSVNWLPRGVADVELRK